MGKGRRNRARQLTINKKIADKKRRARREKGKISAQPKFKDPGVPFKGKFTRPDELRKKRADDIRDRQKDQRSKLHLQNRGLSEILLDAEERDDQFSEKSDAPQLEEEKSNVNQVFKSCYKEFKKVVEAADVVLEILDARDPLGSRCRQVEEAVFSSGSNKRLVLVLNKIDLIPRENLEKWLKYLRQELPTVAFKASTQTQKDHLCQSKVAAIHMTEKLQSSRNCIGANLLMKVLGNYCRNQNILASIRVGVVGFPNVGKSSIINSLKRCRSCVVGGTPGVTKNMQEVILDKHIRLLDSPGIVFATEGSQASLALRNAVKIEKLADVMTPAAAIIRRATKEQLMEHYKVPDFLSSIEFLLLLAKKIGRFSKGGIPDADAAARKLLNDWNNGIIKFFTQPPEVFCQSTHISSELVVEMGKAFDISSMEEHMELEKLSEDIVSDSICVESEMMTEGISKLPKPTVSDEKIQTSWQARRVAKQEKKERKRNIQDMADYVIPVKFKQNKQRIKDYKCAHKKRMKAHRIQRAAVTDLSQTMDSVCSLNV